MVNAIDLRPSTLNLALYAGDGVEFRLVCTNSAGDPLDVTGSFEAQIRLNRLSVDPALAVFSVSMIDAFQGIINLSLSGAQTRALSNDESSNAGKFVGVWDAQWIPAGKQPRTICQGNVECVTDVTR
jgi:hypothetical protein